MPNKLNVEDKSFEDKWFIFDTYHEISKCVYYNKELNNLMTFYSETEETPVDVINWVVNKDRFLETLDILETNKNTVVSFFRVEGTTSVVTILETTKDVIDTLKRKTMSGINKHINDVIYKKDKKLLYKKFAIVKDL
ncbi:hypothetical protein AM2_116 [Lactococcus phage AM2]|uniref:Uncharacterized protein n=7 Tax=Audreyjarvisvirus AM1 TaxID=2845188 RepID=A0A1W6JLQ6_9CAUD|nr:hypothetical protein H1Z30_gp155 [Lactococcus phage AM1]ARM66421.1 hypothetical protein AM2_116 [Lactococcus phage AM2]ARM66598.1 hypothetical protein AM3_116 [Lactococcus phage AM3]ARM67152.1 hypothetical protein AM8_117 [Lactococcus phage AM8]ARM67330.1 hypothetical protein AM9_117 [Lactococcus phage AM9]ARM67509.1 hypothetical protein AM11_117 [Lactococcus phage AM11]ARQ95696.1 hypothetical protein AM12_117 [Lactococcus phage AM12]